MIHSSTPVILYVLRCYLVRLPRTRVYANNSANNPTASYEEITPHSMFIIQNTEKVDVLDLQVYSMYYSRFNPWVGN